MIYITGDMHGDPERFQAAGLRRLRRGDTLIICGDFGFVWSGDKKEQRLLRRLGRKKYNIAFVDGVNENHELLHGYPEEEWCGGRVHHIAGRLYHLMHGQVYQIEDKTIFAMGGGEPPEGGDRDPRYTGCLPSVEDLHTANRNLQQVDYCVDAVVTHDCTGVVKNFLNLNEEFDAHNHVYAFLNEAAKIVQYKYWYFGCHHLDKLIPPKYVGVFREVLPLGECRPK